MKKILVITSSELYNELNHISLILKERYKNSHTIYTLDTFSEQEIFDYAYIIILKKTSEEEIEALEFQVLLWVQSYTNIVYIDFNTIKNSQIKAKKRAERKEQRKKKRSNIWVTILDNKN